ncbi:hypothetical protein [Parageobacillus toebii]|uniref:hypothetical protein n=1 Tax=Parageobacillus toebii TaxID=153151 RepID=UPI00281608D2|nr:hypothetical protein [Parageobacillus toebii]WMT18532.1 hypothetical protein RFB12_14860 [Parageobacillus toebii]
MDKFKQFFDDVSKDILPKLGKQWERIQSYLARFFQDFDVRLLNMLNVLQEKQRELKQFLIDRDRIKYELEQKEKEIKQLRQELLSLQSNDHRHQYELLHQELMTKLDELFTIQSRYIEIEARIKTQEQQIFKLQQDKKALEEERKKLRSKYDEVQQAYREKEQQLLQLSQEIDLLKQKEQYYQTLLENSSSIEETEQIRKELHTLQLEYEQKDKEIQSLQAEYEALINEKKKLEAELLSKVSTINQLNTNLQQTQRQLDAMSIEKEKFQQILRDQEHQLKQLNQKMIHYQQQIRKQEKYIDELIQREQAATIDKKRLEEALYQQELQFLDIMQEYDNEIKELQEKLTNEQNEKAIMAYEYELTKELNEEERKILEREFEPRFHKIYPNMKFTKQFFNDFFHLTVSDRIKAELCIAQLHYQFHTAISKVRPSTVDTKIGAVMEYPFSKEGRIYFRRQNNTIYVYRLNRNKKEQPFVINWLKSFL